MRSFDCAVSFSTRNKAKLQLLGLLRNDLLHGKQYQLQRQTLALQTREYTCCGQCGVSAASKVLWLKTEMLPKCYADAQNR